MESLTDDPIHDRLKNSMVVSGMTNATVNAATGDLEQCGNTLPWYGLRTKSRFEKTAAAVLRGKGYEEFLPLYACSNRWSDRTKTVQLPLFPGYLFCRMDAANRLPVLTTPGIVAIVGLGQTPAAIPDEEIAAIQSIAKSGMPVAPWPFIKEGQRVRIQRGALKDVEGILVTVKNAFRLVVSVNLLQRSVAVEVDRDSIQPL